MQFRVRFISHFVRTSFKYEREKKARLDGRILACERLDHRLFYVRRIIIYALEPAIGPLFMHIKQQQKNTHT